MKFWFLLSLFYVSSWSQSVVAVSELVARGITQDEALIITDRLGSELMNTGRFRVMERSQMNSILSEQGFQDSGACDSRQCEVEMGQLLGVDKLVVGSVGKIGDLYTINLRLLNVSTGEVIQSANQDYTGGIEGLFQEALPLIAQSLAGKKPEAIRQVSTQEEKAPPEVDSRQPILPQEKSVASEPMSQKLLWQIMSGGVAIVAGGAAYYFDGEVKTATEAGDRIQRNYDNTSSDFEAFKTKYAEQKKKSDDNLQNRNIAVGVAALGVVGFGLTFAF